MHGDALIYNLAHDDVFNHHPEWFVQDPRAIDTDALRDRLRQDGVCLE